MNKEYFDREYGIKKRSFRDISKELKISINKVIKIAATFGHYARSKSESQAVALETGRAKHPTAGKKLSEEHKLKLGKSVSDKYESLSNKEKEEISKKRAAAWENLTEEQISAIQSKAVKAARETSKTGSKLEKIIMNHLSTNGFSCQFHKKDLLQNEKLEMDIFIPSLSLCIEIDGPSHFLPIWGEDAFNRTLAADREKNGLLLSHGLSILRIRQVVKNYTLSKTRRLKLLKSLDDKLKEIKDKYIGKAMIHYLDFGV